MRRHALRGCVLALAGVALIPAAPASADETRTVGKFRLQSGWNIEPAYTGVPNGIKLVIKTLAGAPVTDLGDTLKAQLVFGDERGEEMPLVPAFTVAEAAEEEPGHVDEPGAHTEPAVTGVAGQYTTSTVIPTRPGQYTFRFVGSIRGQKVDQSFTTPVDQVRDAAAVEFPAKDPSRSQISERVTRLDTRLTAVRRDADGVGLARILGIVGIALGGIALVLQLTRRPARAKPGTGT